jgi:RNA polymerase sigma factor (TIGR02999 family)
MSDVTKILLAIERGDSEMVAELFPHLYRELREMAVKKIAKELPGIAIRPTELVHEAYFRLIGSEPALHWNGRRHFFGAASEAMRRILVELARQKKQLKRGGGMARVELSEEMMCIDSSVEEMLAVNDLLDQLATIDPSAAEIFKHNYFGGMTTEEAAKVMDLPERSAYRKLRFARTWLYARLRPE